MAATIPEYVDPLLRGQIAAASILGVQVMNVDKQLYDIDLTLLTLIGVVMKALNDHGVVLDAEWLTRLNTALQGTWPAWILNQVNPNQQSG
jgi:hypothetical protein